MLRLLLLLLPWLCRANLDEGFPSELLILCEVTHKNTSVSSSCRQLLKNYTNQTYRCYIGSECDPCEPSSGYVNYLRIQYCFFEDRIVPTTLIVTWLCVLLMCFATIADSFFGPCLIALARSLKMSQNLAGVTLLAFGNGAPDVFSAVTAITSRGPNDMDEGLGLGFLLGSGFLVNTITAGLIILMKPFRMSRRPFIKDTIFYIVAVSWSASILIRRKMYIADSIGFLILYVIYVMTTWLGGVIRNRDLQHSPTMRLLFRLFPWCFQQQELFPATASDNAIVNYHNHEIKTVTLGCLVNKDEPAVSSNPVRLEANGSFLSNMFAPRKLGPNIELVSQRRRNSNEPDPVQMSKQLFQHRVSLSGQSCGGGVDDYSIFSRAIADGVILKVPDSRRMSGQHNHAFNGDESREHEVCSSTKVAKRRTHSKVSNIDQELPYLVRWIIAHEHVNLDDMDADNLAPTRNYPRTQNSHPICPRRAPPQLGTSNSSVGRDDHIEALPMNDFQIKTSLADIMPKASREVEKLPQQGASDGMQSPILKDQDSDSLGHVGVIGMATKEELTKLNAIQEWACSNMWNHFLYCLCPIDIPSWFKKGLIMKTLSVLQAPLILIFRLTIPIVLEDLCEDEDDQEAQNDQPEDEDDVTGTGPTKNEKNLIMNSDEIVVSTQHVLEEENMHGWCKLLNCLHCIMCPITWVTLISKKMHPIGKPDVGDSNMPGFLVAFIIGGVVAVLVFCTSRWYTPPKCYHRPFFASLGFITSIIWIYGLAHELVNSLETLGIVWEISEAILGISIMAFASSVGDIMSNTLLARNGYPRIAYSACMGAPLFNLLIGAGIPYTIKIIARVYDPATFSFTLTQAILFALLLCVLIMNLLVAVCTGWTLPRQYGALLILIYVTFAVVGILIEVDVIVSPPSWKLLTGVE